MDVKVHPITTSQYPTLAKRPQYSVLENSKIKKKFNLNMSYWVDSLKNNLEKR